MQSFDVSYASIDLKTLEPIKTVAATFSIDLHPAGEQNNRN